MKKYLLVGMVVALSLLTACGKKDFSKMTFNDGEYQGHFDNDDKDHPSKMCIRDRFSWEIRNYRFSKLYSLFFN